MNLRTVILPAVAGLCLAVSVSGCSSAPERQLGLRMDSLSTMAELGTVEYKVRKVIKTDDRQYLTIGDRQIGWTVGDRKIIFTATAYIKAGVPMDGFSKDDITVSESGKKVSVHLPRAKVLSFNMPPEEIFTEFEKYGVFRDRFSATEQNTILQLGEKALRDDIPSLGILQDAETAAGDFFRILLLELGFEEVEVEFSER